MKLRYLLPAVMLAVLPVTPSKAFVGISVDFAPPPLPVYVQPPCPVEGYLWTPGYYTYDEAYGEYYWVPGVWVSPPRVGYLWTPGYWGYSDGAYGYNAGYWGPTVGFYGGVDYGFGYGGYGYGGGCWRGNRFLYNRAVTRVNTTVIHNTYLDRTVVRNRATNSRASFNGPRGVQARPTSQQLAASRGPRIAPTGAQMSHRREFAQNHGPSTGARGSVLNPSNRPNLVARRQGRRDRITQGNALVARQSNASARNAAYRQNSTAARRGLRRQQGTVNPVRHQVAGRSYRNDQAAYARRPYSDPRFGSVHHAPRPYPPMAAARYNGGDPGRTGHVQGRQADVPHGGTGHGKGHDDRDHRHG